MPSPVALPAIFALTAFQQVPAAPLQPIGRWVVEYADNTCHVARRFGTPEKPVQLSLKILPGRGINEIVLNEPVDGKAPMKTGNMIITAVPGGEPMTVSAMSGSVEPGSRLLFGNLSSDGLAALEQADTITFAYGGKTISLATRGLKNALAATIACEDDLLRAWGLDAAAYRSIAVRPKSTGSPWNWVRSEDYPDVRYGSEKGGAVGVRLDLDTTGKVKACTVLTSSTSKELDEVTCKSVLRRARYTPARSADGTPVETFTVLRYRWHRW